MNQNQRDAVYIEYRHKLLGKHVRLIDTAGLSETSSREGVVKQLRATLDPVTDSIKIFCLVEFYDGRIGSVPAENLSVNEESLEPGPDDEEATIPAQLALDTLRDQLFLMCINRLLDDQDPFTFVSDELLVQLTEQAHHKVDIILSVKGK